MTIIRRALGAGVLLLSAAVTSCGAAPEPCPACDDGDPCTIDVCEGDGACSNRPAADGYAPAEVQTPGDCWETVCTGGVLGERMADDAPLIDDPCVLYTTCVEGSPYSILAVPGAPCASGGRSGICSAGGACVSAECASCVSTNPCVEAICDILGACSFAPLPDGSMPSALPNVQGDCQIRMCIGGEEAIVPDDLELPAPETCFDASCSGGAAMVTPSPAGVPCKPGDLGICDGAGACVECLSDAGCEKPCNTGVCKDGNCVWTPLSDGTLCGSSDPPWVCVNGFCAP